jgi:hypothetical protein
MLNVVIPYHEGDKAQVARWLQWVEELGGMGAHRLFLMPAMGQKADFQTSLPFTLLEDSYGLKSNWSASNNPVRDASAPNSMIRQIAWHFYLQKLGYWLFCEPDAIPLRPGWHDALDEEYRRERKHFMGALVPGKEGEYPDHMTGVAIWPEDSITCRTLMLPTHATVQGHEGQVELAFDVAAAPEIVHGGRFHATKLIQHVFRGPKFERPGDLVRISKEAVLWHTDKCGGLIRLLREQKNGGCSSTVECHQDESRKAKASDPGSTPGVPPQEKPRVFTYFRPCVDPEALAEQKSILAIWEKNWSDHGWEPVILTEAHARKHPDFQKYYDAFYAMPTVNPRAYEQAAWTRWIAMAANEGGLMVDYDVLIAGSLSYGHRGEISFPLILSDNNPVPCAVTGTKQQYQRAIDAFLAAKPESEQGAPHLSDQIAVQQLGFPAIDICKEVGVAGWRDAKLIHFSHAACGRHRSADMGLFVAGAATSEDIAEPLFEKHCNESRVFDLSESEILEKISALCRKNAGRAMAIARMMK